MLHTSMKCKLKSLHSISPFCSRLFCGTLEQQSNTWNVLQNGIFAVNKTKDKGSTETVEIIKTILMKEIPMRPLKVGHGGVLDKSATGVLVLGIHNGCKILTKFLHGTKKYEVTGQLGISTTTFNETGEIVERLPYEHVTEEVFVEALKKFVGKIPQTPPVYSALKMHGRRYSDLAREGKKVNPKPRLVKCHSIKCTYFDSPYFSLSVKCGGGFYIRSLINDIGKDVGSCAHVIKLHRTQQGVFKENEALNESMWTMENIIKSIQDVRMKHRHLFNIIKTEEKEVLLDDTLFEL